MTSTIFMDGMEIVAAIVPAFVQKWVPETLSCYGLVAV
jgi:hypothetical protein